MKQYETMQGYRDLINPILTQIRANDTKNVTWGALYLHDLVVEMAPATGSIPKSLFGRVVWERIKQDGGYRIDYRVGQRQAKYHWPVPSAQAEAVRV